DEYDALEAQLAVLDLGDVLEVGADAGDAAERLALLEVEALALDLVEGGELVVEHDSGVTGEQWCGGRSCHHLLNTADRSSHPHQPDTPGRPCRPAFGRGQAVRRRSASA